MSEEVSEADELTEWQVFNFAEEEFGPVSPAGSEENSSIRGEQVRIGAD